MSQTPDADVAIIGAGAAGLMTAIAAARHAPDLRIHLLDGARAPGAKILVSGGGRCNVTNASVTADDFHGGRPGAIRQVLRALPVPETIAVFRDLGVPLREEPRGKLFPASGRARDVLDALAGEVARRGVHLRPSHRVIDLVRDADGFVVTTPQGPTRTRAVVLTTGGLALPKSGSDGAGYGMAARLGHTIIPTTPALAPLIVASGPGQFHASASGVAHDVRLTVTADARRIAAIDGPLLWTHVGVSGPAALDASRHWLRARLDGRAPVMTASLAGGLPFEAIEARWIAMARSQPRLSIGRAMATLVPESVGSAVLRAIGVDATETLATLERDARRRLAHALDAWPIAVQDSRGYTFAEATAGGVDLAEIDPRTMASRRCPGLYLAGEILDVDGRLGGFNFQWAWSSGTVAGRGVAAQARRT